MAKKPKCKIQSLFQIPKKSKKITNYSLLVYSISWYNQKEGSISKRILRLSGDTVYQCKKNYLQLRIIIMSNVCFDLWLMGLLCTMLIKLC